MSGACGKCTLCCTLMKVAMDPPKPERQPCLHCSEAGGCAIYAQRPTPCAEFKCVWLGTQDVPGIRMPAQLRPDRTGIVLEVNAAATLIAHCETADAWQREPMASWLRRMALRGNVMIETGDAALLLAFDGSTERLRRVGVHPETNCRLYVREAADA